MPRLVVLCVLLLASCGGRELGWLVPRATVAVVLRSTETGLVTEGYLAIGAPLSRRIPRPRHAVRTRPSAPLLGPGPACVSVRLCRLEVAARAEAFTEIAEEEVP